MYAQFFGSFLLRNEAVTTEQLLDAFSKMKNARIRLGTLAMHKGLMTAAEVDECCFIQTREDKRFGEIALDRGYLTFDQVEELLRSQGADYLLLGQILVENQVFNNEDFSKYLKAYQQESKIAEDDMDMQDKETIKGLIEQFCTVAETPVSEHVVMFLNLLFNDLIRFIGEDFTPLAPKLCKEFPVKYCVCQSIDSVDYSSDTYVDMDENAAIEFASRYAKDQFTEFDEYVQASLEDFLNLHNGLFLVNMSNLYSIECSLKPPYSVENNIAIEDGKSLLSLPIVYPFGTIQLLITV